MFKGKHFFIFFLLIVCTMASGCFHISSDTTFHKDGSADVKNTFIAVPLFAEKMQEIGAEAQKNHPGSSLREIHDGNMSGIEETTHYATITDLANADGNMFKTVEGKAKGVQYQKGWLYDIYALDLLFENASSMRDGMKEDDFAIAQAMLSSMRCDISMSFPYAVEKHNADKVTGEGTSLTWDLSSTLMNGGSKSMQATFRLWNMTHIYITAASAIVLAIFFLGTMIGGFFCRKASPLQFSVFGLSFVSFLALIGIVGYSAYSVFMLPALTDRDIISPIAEKSTMSRLQDAFGTSDAAPLSKTKGDILTKNSTTTNPAPKSPTPQPAQRSTPQDAVRTFQNFHQNITDRRLRAAYDTLSADMQSEMTFEGWAPGFNTTVSSTPLNIEITNSAPERVTLTYTLRAVDNPGGTRYFNGRATLVKRGAVWEIAEIINKPM